MTATSQTFSARIVCLLLLCLLLTTACEQRMANQPKYQPLEPSAFFRNGQSSRPLVPGTIAREPSNKGANESFISKSAGANDFPSPVTPAVVERGRERYEIFCAMCHGAEGLGDGSVVARGFTQPKSFLADEVRKSSNRFYFDVITNGYSGMGRYSHQVMERDRWAIIAYIRELQQLHSRASNDLLTGNH